LLAGIRLRSVSLVLRHQVWHFLKAGIKVSFPLVIAFLLLCLPKEEARKGTRRHMRNSSPSGPEQAQHIAFFPFCPGWLGASAGGDKARQRFPSPSFLHPFSFSVVVVPHATTKSRSFRGV